MNGFQFPSPAIAAIARPMPPVAPIRVQAPRAQPTAVQRPGWTGMAIDGAQPDATAKMMGTVMHEMRNFLAPMEMAIAVLRQHQHEDEEGAKRALDVLGRQTIGLQRLVGDLLDVSRAASGKLELDPQPCDLREVARDAVEMCMAAAAGKSQALTLAAGCAPVMVEGDPLRLCQAIGNLVLNAVRYSPKGGHVSVSVGVKGAFATLAVEDDGIGMDPELAARAFELHEQAQAGKHGGLGIGLYLVRAIATLHGGSVQAHSDGPGAGSVFTMKLPAR